MRELRLDARHTADFELIANGGFEPLGGFQARSDWASVVATMRLADGRPWPIPITLGSRVGEVGETLALVGHELSRLGTLAVEEVYERDLLLEAERVYGTRDASHPGVAALLREPSRTNAGPIRVDALPRHTDAIARHLL